MSQQVVKMIPGKKHAPEDLGRVLIVGMGKSGVSSLAYCQKLLGSRVSTLAVVAGEGHADAYEAIPNSSEDLRNNDLFKAFISEDDIRGEYDICIISPGIPEHSALYDKAVSLSKEVVSEVEFAWRESAATSSWVGITGTNGKTTTTALVAHILQAAGKAATAVGNIGDTCLDAVAKGQTDIYVAELSSYQLASTKFFAANVAVLLNITPDHLAWHGSFAAYEDAKLKLFANHTPEKESIAIVDATDERTRAFLKKVRHDGGQAGSAWVSVPLGTAAGLEGDMRLACGSRNAAFIHEGMLRLAFGEEEQDIIRVDELQIQGRHNVANALAAASVAQFFHVPKQTISAALRDFAALEHRIEPCGVIDGVCFYNDSKATNIDAVLTALAAFTEKQVLLLVGGQDKGSSVDPLTQACLDDGVKVVCFGEAGLRFYQYLSGQGVEAWQTADMKEAFECACKQAQPEDVVLLSPACASFDEFDSFEHRGIVFKELVSKCRQTQAPKA